MHAGEDSGSFWEPGNYRRITQRVSEAERMCKDMVALLKERAAIEKAYATDLHAWTKRGRELLKGGPENETTEALFEGILTEGKKLGDLHLKIKNKLSNDVIKELKSWTKDSYHKSMWQIKEKNELEEAFKKAQKPWAKLYRKVDDAKTKYHTAFRTELSASDHLRNAYGDPDLSLSQVKKIRDRSEQCKENLSKAEEKFLAALRDIHLYNPRYIEEMSSVFHKSQEKEWERLQFFKKIMFYIQKCFNLSQNPAFQQIYDEFYASIENADPKKELQWWLKNSGPHMGMKWPTCEEYGREIVKCKTNTVVAPGTTLTYWRSVGEDLYESNRRSEMYAKDKTDSSDKRTSKVNKKITRRTSANLITTLLSTIPFDEDEDASDNETDVTFVDCEDAGVQVKALQCYVGNPIVELDFKEGDIFQKLDGPDEQGWCRGRKDGRVGLYSAGYVEIIEQ